MYFSNIIFRRELFKIADKMSRFNVLPEIKYLKNNEMLDIKSFEELQLYKLKKLLIHCSETVPYYNRLLKKLKINPIKIDTLNVLNDLPQLTKENIKNNYDELLSNKFQRDELSWGQTGGSTGYPLTYAVDSKCRVKSRAAFYRGLTWSGWVPGDQVISFWGRPILKNFKNMFYSNLKSTILKYNHIDAHILSEECIEKYLCLINKKLPRIIIGYSSTLNLLSDYILKNSIDLKGEALLGVYSTAEMLLPPMKRNIENAFKTKVYNSYGSSEVQAIADTCNKGNMHIHVERVILGKSETSLTVTDLDNYAMPMIKYRINDQANFSKAVVCNCGRNLPIIKDLVGRSNLNILTKNGKIIHSEFFTHLFEQLDIFKNYDINCFKIHQCKDYKIEISFSGGLALKTEDKESICKIINNFAGEEFHVVFKKMQIQNKENKFMFISSDFPFD